MNIQKIKLDKEKNKQYYQILDEINIKIQEWNELNKRIRKIKNRKVFLFITKSEINQIKKTAEDLNNDYVKWTNEVSKFMIDIYINVEGPENPNLTFLHFKEVLVRKMREVDDIFKLTINNFYRIKDSYNNQINFNIAIFGIILSIFALLYSLFDNQKYTYNDPNLLLDSVNIETKLKLIKTEESVDSNIQKIEIDQDSKNNPNLLLDSLNIIKEEISIDSNQQEIKINQDSISNSIN